MASKATRLLRGRVLRVSGRMHLVQCGDAVFQCEVLGRVKSGRRSTTSPVYVGDWVRFVPTGRHTGAIESIEPRSSRFSRRTKGPRACEQVIAVNVDILLIVTAVHEPEPRAGFIDRAIIMAVKSDIEPVICISKIDLGSREEIAELAAPYSTLRYRVLRTSAITRAGIEELGVVLGKKTSAVVGQSGVGKSSLLNCIDPDFKIRTQRLMHSHDRGRHTTSSARLYRLPSGGWVADTPGIKHLRLWGVSRSELAWYFSEMRPFLGLCRFRDCSHLHEPGCAVREAVDSGRISARRYAGYCRIMESLQQEE